MFVRVKIINEDEKRTWKGEDERIRGSSEGRGVRYTVEGMEGEMSRKEIEN